MKKRSIGIIIGLMSFALLGVVAIQLYFLHESYKLQSQLFDHDVKEALNNVADKLTKQDAINFLNSKVQEQDQTHKNQENVNAETADNVEHFVTNDSLHKPVKSPTVEDRRLAHLRDSLYQTILNQKLDEDLAGTSVQVQMEQYIDEFGIVRLRPSGAQVVQVARTRGKLHKWDTLRLVYTDPQFGLQTVIKKVLDPQWKAQQARLQNVRKMHNVEEMIQAAGRQNLQAGGNPNIIQMLNEEYQKTGEPLKNRINPLTVDSLLRIELVAKGISIDYSYEVSTANTDSVIFTKAINAANGMPVFLAAEAYNAPIFPKEVLTDQGTLKIYFPQKNKAILSTMTASMATTAGLLFVLIFCFGYILFAIIRQKKVSQMKTDFINNMTHEFKTPVSTIMIASDALRDNELTEDKSRITRLANIIYEENARLGSHIERVLNIARIDNNDFKLDKKPVDINEMVALVVDSMELKLKKSNAIINLHLDANNAIIKADELHFSNLLYNLIDNAIKYSKDQPEITVSTLNKNGHVIIRVSDKGIGMSRDQQTKIFEQFYRIPTGNLHDVKGFGLGLSYVNTIVKRLNGTIGVRSEKDKGSEFELKFSVA